ncbi:transmembrane protein, putative (macronuclear) [Tetrahymena thermophila SB210]|uniref:Transmembrane protein, putative n=1 Tax=Tetrahymena thermophila (strain SB210) TaxID=312017 RepID=W7XAE3_TETTS|nr:transmembrane protein, putative [Tetrahymena thermophila SB210]EWS74297.1 transmembrane protein, putative [Tetrahymena thermophila SB210]|eukprot:XP_012653185.1 transmembrane protein, putative [Tetrahymena thermophila SB210]
MNFVPFKYKEEERPKGFQDMVKGPSYYLYDQHQNGFESIKQNDIKRRNEAIQRDERTFVDMLMDRKGIDDLLIKRYMNDPKKNKIFSTKDNEPIGQMKIIKVNQNSLNNSQVKEGISLIDTRKINQSSIKRVNTSQVENQSFNYPTEKYQNQQILLNQYSPIQNNSNIKIEEYPLNNRQSLYQTVPLQQQVYQINNQYNQPIFQSEKKSQDPIFLQSPQKYNQVIYSSPQKYQQFPTNMISSSQSLDQQINYFQNNVNQRSTQTIKTETNLSPKLLFDGPNPHENIKRKQNHNYQGQKSSTQSFKNLYDSGLKKPVFDVSTPFVGKQSSYQNSRKSSFKGQESPQMYLRDEISPIYQNYQENGQFIQEEDNVQFRLANNNTKNNVFNDEFDEFKDFVIEDEVSKRNSQLYESFDQQNSQEKSFKNESIKKVQQTQSNQSIKKMALALIAFLLLLIIFIFIK